MRRSLRRSCATCAKAKQSCDRQTPKCSRCVEKNSSCVYANEPSSVNGSGRENDASTHSSRGHRAIPRVASSTPPEAEHHSSVSPLSTTIRTQSMVDPFNTYPSTNLPPARVQGLIHHFLSKIVYQYYPWDTNPSTNPFVTSWWHLALSDPTLFHVSLQTAALDDELNARKGFSHSNILMNDSVSLLRLKVQDPSQAIQDATMNAVVTLAAIEHGKGNLSTSRMHIEGVKSMVKARGGLTEIKSSNPLTARMVAWVAMLVVGRPQFWTEDKSAFLDGVVKLEGRGDTLSKANQQSAHFANLAEFDIDPAVTDILSSLRAVFHRFDFPGFQKDLSVTERQDLASSVIHELLLLEADPARQSDSVAISESIRYAIVIYMFIIHGPTYYSHLTILKTLVAHLSDHLSSISGPDVEVSLKVWLLSVGMIASIGTEAHEWYITEASTFSARLKLHTWEDIRCQLTRIIWLGGAFETPFQRTWEQIIDSRYISDDG